MRKVLFRVDASSEIGLGHLMRCLALAQHLVELDISVTFAVLSSTLPYCRSRSDWVGEVYSIPDEWGAHDGENESLISYINKYQFDWVVLDGYQFTQELRQQLSLSCAKLAVFDDENNSGKLFADLVVNGANQATTIRYEQTAEGARLCIGERYRVLRTEFSRAATEPLKNRDCLTVTFGGSDPYDLTIPMLKALDTLNKQSQFDRPLDVNVLTGSAYANLEKLESLLSSLSYEVRHLHDSHSISELFKNSRLVVSAAGGTQFELLACHTPSILLTVAENQKPATKDAENQGWCVTFDGRDVTPKLIAEKTRELWTKEHLLEQMHEQSKVYSDTKGADRVIEAMQAL